MKKRPMFFVLLLSFLFISCENLLSPKDSYNNGDGKTYTITGDINIEGALPNELFNENSANSVARTGFPTIPNFSDSDLNLYVSATNADSNSTIEGTINAEKTQFSINLPKGQWTITVSGEKSDVVILEGSVTVVLNDEYPVTNSEIIILKPKTTGGKGNLFLKLALDIESFNCGGVKATLSSSENSKKYIFFTASDGNPASEIDLEFSDISSGTYSFKLEFYERMSSDGSDYECENIIYILKDTVNIFDGLTTNEWSGTGYSEDTFTLTQEMITSFAMTTFYVSENGVDSNLGTFFEPVKTIQNAVDKVIAMNEVTVSSEENPYKILLLSDIISDDPFESNNNALVNINPSSASGTPLYLTISKCGDGNATINANRSSSDTGRVMYIGKNANVTLQNLILKGGYLTDTNGAGLYIENNATVKINNCKISDNQAKDGGGLYLCPIANDDGGNLLELSSCTISSNTATSSGGGILFCPTHSSSDDMTTTLNLTNCTINSNKAKQKGGGIYSYGKNPEVILDACDITNNSLGYEYYNENAFGGGLCIEDGSVIMKDGSISKNKYSSDTSSYGGGVYINNSSTFTMTSGEISENSAKYGGGVATDGSFFMSGGTISENIVTNSSDGSGGNGSAVAVLTDGLFTVSESITINGDVYLSNDQTITVSNSFEGGEVMITPNKYANDGVGVQVLKPIEGMSLTTEIVRKFEVTPQVLSDGYEYWHVESGGKLAKDSIFYVKSGSSEDGEGTLEDEGGTLEDEDGTLDNPFKTIQAAVNKAIKDNTAGTTKFKILLQSNVEDTSIVSYDSTNNSSFVNIDPTNNLTLEIASYGENSFTINANKTEDNSGRVMYIGQKANVTLRNVNISGGNLKNGNGGAIYCSGTLKLVNSTISNSKAKNGGGIYIENGTLTMNDGATISTCTSLLYGGGVTVYGSDNGVQVSGGTFNMAGGTISDCTAEYGCRGGVYVETGTFTMSGGAVISSNNDVYLANGTTITVTGNLTGTTPVATITPDEYNATRQVLVAGSGVTLSNNLVKQFNVTAEGGKEWFVDSYGYLGKVPETETNDEGTAVYLMESYDNLLWIAQELRTNGINSFNIKLTNDIEIPSGKWTSPLDVTNASTIDGQGHSIKFNDGSGLFERFHGGSIENLVLEGTINTSSYKNHHNGQCGVGVLAGSTYKTTIKNVVSTVDVVDTGDGYVGGLIGYFGGKSNIDGMQPGSFIQNCAVYANITSTNGTVGGLVGGTWSGTQCWQINNCIYKGNVTGGTDQGVGAIIGTHNTGRTSTFKDTWYCANGTSKIVGKCNNDGNGEKFYGYGTVISKTAADIATDAAATLLNTNSDGTLNDVWEYIPGSEYPTLKQNR